MDWRPTRWRLYSILYVRELASASWSVGELVRRRVDWLPTTLLIQSICFSPQMTVLISGNRKWQHVSQMKQFQNHFFLHSSIRCEKNTCYLALKLCCNYKLLSPFPPLQWTAITFLGSLSSHSLTLCVKYNNWLKQRIQQPHPQVRSLGYLHQKVEIILSWLSFGTIPQSH